MFLILDSMICLRDIWTAAAYKRVTTSPLFNQNLYTFKISCASHKCFYLLNGDAGLVQEMRRKWRHIGILSNRLPTFKMKILISSNAMNTRRYMFSHSNCKSSTVHEDRYRIISQVLSYILPKGFRGNTQLILVPTRRDISVKSFVPGKQISLGLVMAILKLAGSAKPA